MIKKLLTKELFYIFLLGIIVILSSIALFHSGFFRTIDDITTVRIMYMVKELQRHEWIHNFPVRISTELSHNYGYPLYLFYGPLVYYVGAILMMFGKVSHIVATKWVYVFPLLVGPFFFYWAVRQKMALFPALVAAAVYTLFPFRGFDTYIRGGVGEAWAMAFLPLVFGGIFYMQKNRLAGGLIFAVSLTLCMLSHNISGLLIVGLVVLYGLYFHLKDKHFWSFLLLGMGMSVFFWLPSVYYLKIVKVSYTNQNTGEILQHLEPFLRLITPKIPLPIESKFSPVTLYFFLISFLIFFVGYKKKDTLKRKEVLFWGGLGLLMYFSISLPFILFWKLTLPITRLLQFPWRVLILLSFIQPFFIGWGVMYIKKVQYRVLLGVLIIISTLIFLPGFKPKEYSYFYEYTAEDTGSCAATWGDEYIPIWVKDCPDKPPVSTLQVNKDTQLHELFNNGITIKAEVSSSKSSELIVNKYYFPGWKMFVDGKEIPLNYTFSKAGIFKGKVPSGHHIVLVVFTKTTVMWIADIISLVSLVIFGYLSTVFIIKKRNSSKKT